MSDAGSNESREHSPEPKKRKREVNEEDLEIDLDAPEPPSKKALRRAKKSKPVKTSSTTADQLNSEKPVLGAEDVVPNRGKRSEYGVWIGNLSFTTSKQDLLNFFTGDPDHQIAEEDITRINLPAGQVKFGKFQNKGFAYVDLSDAQNLQSALQLSEKLLGGRRVLIKNANSFEGRPKANAKEESGNPPSKRLFIGNLDFDTTVEDLEKHFGVCGPIHNTQMATFEDSGKCKGYAWVEFEQLSSGQSAMRGWVEEGSQNAPEEGSRSKRRIWVGKINGRKLRMEYAEDKTTRYNKRFGKNSNREKGDVREPAIEEVSTRDGGDMSSMSAPDKVPTHTRRSEERANGKHQNQRYTNDTVRKLTGAIVASQGQKVTFE